MKNALSLTMILLLFSLPSPGQNFILKGRIRCENQGTNSTKGASNIIVVPGFVPARSEFTQSNEKAGFFQLNLGPVYNDLKDKVMVLYIVSRCENCSDKDKVQFVQNRNVFIDQKVGRNLEREDFLMTIKDWKMSKKCDEIALSGEALLTIMDIVKKRPARSEQDVKNGTLTLAAVASATPLSTMLTNAIGVAVFVDGGIWKAKSLGAGKIRYGDQLRNASMILTTNSGFNFSPARDFSEAVFWNPSAIILNKSNSGISLISNVRNNTRLSGYFNIDQNVVLGGGALYAQQDEFRPAVFNQIGFIPSLNKFGETGRKLQPSYSDSVKMKLREYSFFFSGGVKISKSLSVGASVKSLHQQFSVPDSLYINSDGVSGYVNVYNEVSVTKQRFDFDISATYLILSNLQLGLNFMNVMDSKLYGDAFAKGTEFGANKGQRSLGVGLTYMWWRINVGSDVLMTKNGLREASFGLNFVPLNNILLSGGYAVKQKSYSASIRVKHFKIGYIDDNGLMVNELRKPKVSFFKGKIYGGFSFNF